MQLDEVNQAAAEGKEPAFGVHLDIASYGDMSSFFWAHSQPPPPGLVECDVAYGELSRVSGQSRSCLSASAGSDADNDAILPRIRCRQGILADKGCWGVERWPMRCRISQLP